MGTNNIIPVEDMTLRDHAQIAFMAAIISNPSKLGVLRYIKNEITTKEEVATFVAELGGLFADAFLENREIN
jgi:hypothetical protein